MSGAALRMRFGVVSLFPEILELLRAFGVVGRALREGLLELHCWNPRDYTADRRRSVDDRPYGGGPGMVLTAPPLAAALDAARAVLGAKTQVLYLSPQGRRITQDDVRALAQKPALLLLAGRYEGVDERLVVECVDDELSLGDFVLSGGELAAQALLDAVARLVPGVLGHAESAARDSFSAGLLDCPHYTRPEEFRGSRVPAVLLGGDHEAIRRWRRKQSLGRTWERRPELLECLHLDPEARRLLEEYILEKGGPKTGG